ncbi:MAG: flavin reductase [Anaerolineaceae bacterium]|nr:flavin reductase [Anaerolineaceae bacterium]
MIKPEDLKEAMRSWLTGVAIVTSKYGEAVHGMTANSFNSLALDPPTVLVALRHHTRTQQLVRKSGIYAVSILDIHQIGLARRFAGQTETDKARFDSVETFEMTTGAPMIQNATAYLDCKVVKDFDIGDTTVFIGEVVASKVISGDGKDPLLYFNRQWRKLERL